MRVFAEFVILFVARVRFVVIVSVVRLVGFWLRRFSIRALSRFVFIVRVLAYRLYSSGGVRFPFVFLIRWFVFERCVFISYRPVQKKTLVYVCCCVLSFVLGFPCVTARFGLSAFVCFHFVSSFTCGTFHYRCIVPS